MTDNIKSLLTSLDLLYKRNQIINNLNNALNPSTPNIGIFNTTP